MLAFFCLIVPKSPRIVPPTPQERKLEKLARQRCLYENQGPPYEAHIFSAELDGFVCFAYYPLGKASPRYVIDQSSLTSQSLHQGKPRTDWILELEKAKSSSGPKPRPGTLRSVIEGQRIKNPRLTTAQRVVLAAKTDFAVYGEIPVNHTLFVSIDGPGIPYERVYYDPSPKERGFLPITPQESAALGLGKKGWVPPGKYRVYRP